MKEAAAFTPRPMLRPVPSSVPHAVQIHGHEAAAVRPDHRSDRAIEVADKLQRALTWRAIRSSPSSNGIYAHKIYLLGGVIPIHFPHGKKAEALLKQLFNLPTNLLVQAVNKREWPAFLDREDIGPRKRCAAAQQLLAHPSLVVQATGHIEAGFAQLAIDRPADAGASSNAALKALQ